MFLGKILTLTCKMLVLVGCGEVGNHPGGSSNSSKCFMGEALALWTGVDFTCIFTLAGAQEKLKDFNR